MKLRRKVKAIVCRYKSVSNLVALRFILIAFGFLAPLSLNAQQAKTYKALFKQESDIFQTGDFNAALLLAREGIQWGEEHQNDSVQAVFYYYAGISHNFLRNIDSALWFFSKADQLALKHNLIDIQIRIKLRQIQIYQIHRGESDRALQLLQEVTSMIEANYKPQLKADLEALWAGYEKVQNQFDKALQHYLKELEIRRKHKDRSNEAICLQNIGGVMLDIGKNIEGIGYFKEAVKILTENNYPQFSPITYLNIGLAFENIKKLDSALFYVNHAIEMAKKYGDKRTMALAYHKLSEMKKVEKVTPVQDTLLTKAFSLALKMGSIEAQITVKNSLAKAAIANKQYDEAAKHLNEALVLARKSHNTLMQSEILISLAHLSHDSHDYKKVFSYMTDAMAHKDSLYRNEMSKSTQQIEARFQNERKKVEIEKLNAEKKLMQVSQQSRQQALLGWSALVILIVVIGWIITYSRKKQQLLRKENEVEQLQHRMSETRQIALRAQMNPHFIFNCMAAIDHYILSNETKLASDLLTSFAGLIRTILEQSERELIPLEQELHSLNLYLQLEQIRFGNKFTYSIETIENLDLDIPPLLLQPYVENAVLHGVSHLLQSQPGEIKIKVDQDQADKIRIMIRDNGVGTKESATINKRNRPAHQSMGTRITEERINLFRTMHQVDIQVLIKDLYSEVEQGTEVNILIGKLSEN